MAKKIAAPALKDGEQLATVITRLKRANGQMNAVIAKMS